MTPPRTEVDPPKPVPATLAEIHGHLSMTTIALAVLMGKRKSVRITRAQYAAVSGKGIRIEDSDDGSYMTVTIKEPDPGIRAGVTYIEDVEQ